MGARIPHNDKTISPTQELSSVAQSKKNGGKPNSGSRRRYKLYFPAIYDIA